MSNKTYHKLSLKLEKQCKQYVDDESVNNYSPGDMFEKGI